MKNILVAFVIFSSLAQASQLVDAPKKTDSTSLLNLSGFAESLINFLPKDMSIAVKTYLEVMQPKTYKSDESVGGSNKGLIQTLNNATSSDACLKDLAKKFYADPDVGFKDNPTEFSIISIKNSMPKNNKEPGLFWKKAMRLTEGNPNLAMGIVALCGHDDVNVAQAGFCPARDSAFYYPKGLSSEVDISDSLRKYVIDTQSYNASADNISGKNYHFYGSAYLGCKMLQNGVSASKIADYAQKFAYVYRRVRLCRSASETVKQYKKLEDLFQNEFRDFKRKQKEGVEPTLQDIVKRQVSVGTGLPPSLAFKLSRQDSEKKIAAAVERSVSAYYASKVYLETTGCPTGSSGEVSEGMKILSLGDPEKNSVVFGSNEDSFNEKCQSISNGNCDLAKKTLATWDADFKWTMAQHKAGAEFGAKNCALPTSALGKKIPSLCSSSGSKSDASTTVAPSSSDSSRKENFKTESAK